jgi:hypothetical protein
MIEQCLKIGHDRFPHHFEILAVVLPLCVKKVKLSL